MYFNTFINMSVCCFKTTEASNWNMCVCPQNNSICEKQLDEMCLCGTAIMWDHLPMEKLSDICFCYWSTQRLFEMIHYNTCGWNKCSWCVLFKKSTLLCTAEQKHHPNWKYTVLKDIYKIAYNSCTMNSLQQCWGEKVKENERERERIRKTAAKMLTK